MNKTQTSIPYFLYARKSSESDDRQAASIEDQVRVLTDLAAKYGITIGKIVREAHSAKEPHTRPEFAAMLRSIEKGKAQGILCWKLDRLARNPADEGQIKWMLQRGVIKEIKTPDRDYRPEDNVLITAVEFGMANQYILDLSKNVKRGLYQRAERGEYPAHAPVGYLNDPGAPKGKKLIVPDPGRWNGVRKLFDMILTGAYTVDEIWRFNLKKRLVITNQGQPLCRSSVYKLFTNRFYYGDYEYPRGSGNWRHGIHTPMILPEEYDAIQEKLGRKGKPRPHVHTFDFTGMIRCGTCGAMVTAENKTKHQQNGNIHHYIYYHCSWRKEVPCAEKSMRDADLLTSLVEITDGIYVPPEFHAWAMEWLRNDLANDAQYQTKNTAKQKKEYADLEKNKDGLIKMRARGELTEDEFAKQKSEFNREMVRLHSNIDENVDVVAKIMAKADEKLVFAIEAKGKILNGTREERREVLANLGSNPVLQAQKLDISIEKPLLRIKDIHDVLNDVSGGFEPPGTSEKSMDMEQIYASSPLMRRRKDSNLRTGFPVNFLAGSSIRPLWHASTYTENALEAYQRGPHLSNIKFEGSRATASSASLLRSAYILASPFPLFVAPFDYIFLA